jgi:hypothetical protein
MSGREIFVLRLVLSFVVLILPEASLKGVALCEELTSNNSPQNSTDFSHPKTSYMMRIGVIGGDEVGGPVKYNTRFPKSPTPPNPASYYRGLGKTLLHLEAPFEQKGAFVLGLGKKFDWSKRKIDSQFNQTDGLEVKIQQFRQSTVSTYFGWAVGESFIQSPWLAYLLLGYDQSQIDFVLNSRASEGFEETLRPISYIVHSTYFLTKLLRNLGTYSFVSFHAGLHASMPLFQQVKRSGPRDVAWLDERFDIRSRPGFGLALMLSTSF